MFHGVSGVNIVYSIVGRLKLYARKVAYWEVCIFQVKNELL